MTNASPTRAREIHDELPHPVIDADGHIIEYMPEMDRLLREEGVPGGMADFLQTATFDGGNMWARQTPDERLRDRTFRHPWWGFPADARDLATATAPRLFYERLDELGLDLAICYPSMGLLFPAQREEGLRRRGSRAYNRYAAEQFEGLSDRLLPVAVIPTCDPQEAIDELDHAVEELGFRAAMIGGFARREFGDGHEQAFWIDSLGLDSLHDYDPLWERFVHHGITPSVHSGSMGWSGRRSISNFSYNHMGNFAGAGEATAKSLFFGGVFHRFPKLRVAFLEGGVSWAVQMVVGLVEHWEKRGPAGLEERNPSRIDADLFDELMAQHRGTLPVAPGYGKVLRDGFDTPDVVNDFALAGIESEDDILRQVTTQCFFGCEADDPLASLAFDTSRLPGDTPLAPVFSSDVGHWDVAHMHEVLPEAYEHIENGWMDDDQLRAFLCDNTLRMYGESNPAFFAGTVVEDYAKRTLAG